MCKPLIFWQEPGLPDALVEVNWHWKDSTNCTMTARSGRFPLGGSQAMWSTSPGLALPTCWRATIWGSDWVWWYLFCLVNWIVISQFGFACPAGSQKIAGHPGTHAMTGSRTLETHAATSTHWANGRLHMAMGAQCLSGLGKWGPGHLALYQCQGVPGHPRHR